MLCTGNIGNPETKAWITSLVPDPANAFFVKGEEDEEDLPLTQRLQVGNLTIGLIHGHQVTPWGDLESLTAVHNMIDCDILVYGNTYTPKVMAKDGKFFVAPGSFTGIKHITLE